MRNDVNDRIQTLRVHLDSVNEELHAYGELITEYRREGADPTELFATVAELARIHSAGRRELLALYAARRNRNALPPPAETLPLEVTKPEPETSIEAWRPYKGFRADMVHREQIERDRQREIGASYEIEIDTLAGQLKRGDSRKSIERRMRKSHLDPKRDWPPSTWPEEEPHQPFDSATAHRLALVAGFPALVWLALDVISDGRLDGVVYFTRLVCSPWHG